MNSRSTSAPDPVEFSGVHKAFGASVALDGFDLRVPPGQVTGFLGPNGAGKSTAIRVLLGLVRPDAGRVRLLGGDPWRDAVALHRRVAYVPGDVAVWPNLTGGEVIDYLTRLRGPVEAGRRDALVDRLALDPTKKARTYSTGNRQKVALVAAFTPRVDLLVLDEPTSGLDPLMESVFTELVREARDAGTSVLLSSHILSEVEKVCDTVTIIREGRAVESGTLAELRHLTRSAVTAVLDRDAEPALEGLPGVHDLVREPVADGLRVRFSVDDDRVAPALSALGAAGARSVTAAPPSLEELFLRHYGADVPQPAASEGNGAS